MTNYTPNILEISVKEFLGKIKNKKEVNKFDDYYEIISTIKKLAEDNGIIYYNYGGTKITSNTLNNTIADVCEINPSYTENTINFILNLNEFEIFETTCFDIFIKNPDDYGYDPQIKINEYGEIFLK